MQKISPHGVLKPAGPWPVSLGPGLNTSSFLSGGGGALQRPPVSGMVVPQGCPPLRNPEVFHTRLIPCWESEQSLCTFCSSRLPSVPSPGATDSVRASVKERKAGACPGVRGSPGPFVVCELLKPLPSPVWLPRRSELRLLALEKEREELVRERESSYKKRG